MPSSPVLHGRWHADLAANHEMFAHTVPAGMEHCLVPVEFELYLATEEVQAAAFKACRAAKHSPAQPQSTTSSGSSSCYLLR